VRSMSGGKGTAGGAAVPTPPTPIPGGTTPVPAPASSKPAVNVTTGLAAHWALKEGTGTTTVNAVGGHKAKLVRATWSGNVPPALQGVSLNSLSFHGRDHVELGAGGALDNLWTGGGMAALWIQPFAMPAANAVILEKKEWSIALTREGALSVRHNGPGGTWIQWTTEAGLVATNAWRHVAVSFDKGSIENELRLFVNGEGKRVTHTASPTRPASFTSDQSCALTWAGAPPAMKDSPG
jgi:hypothetical protein